MIEPRRIIFCRYRAAFHSQPMSGTKITRRTARCKLDAIRKSTQWDSSIFGEINLQVRIPKATPTPKEELGQRVRGTCIILLCLQQQEPQRQKGPQFPGIL